jgi:hypothetical protein
MPSVLFVHNSFPAQFEFLARELVCRGWACAAVAREHASIMPGVKLRRYGLRRGSAPDIFGPAAPVEADMIRGAHDGLAAFQVRNSKVKNGRAEPPLLHRRKSTTR